ncbi:hypothetical protein G6011_08159 [Alternaria panax]|uniref:Uncharacterized protein n=1 Tax=Alternaria panax TaxID=48097 RepID=A0AAD4FI65_9PLEO|nr:hypothetical protein G6011_08159 [Alternaria panax]
MSLPSPSTNHTFLPLVAEPRPRFDGALPPTSANESVLTSTAGPPVLLTKVMPQKADLDPLLQTSLPSQFNAKETSIDTGEEIHAGENTQGGEKLVARPWPVPHAVEHQKHALYGSMLGMGAAKVSDKWGFSSATVSRAHTPDIGNNIQ